MKFVEAINYCPRHKHNGWFFILGYVVYNCLFLILVMLVDFQKLLYMYALSSKDYI